MNCAYNRYVVLCSVYTKKWLDALDESLNAYNEPYKDLCRYRVKLYKNMYKEQCTMFMKRCIDVSKFYRLGREKVK